MDEYKIGKHKGPIVSYEGDWDGEFTIFYCFKCKKLHIHKKMLMSGTSELLIGEIIWGYSLEDYTEKYIAYPEVKEKAEKMLGIKIS